MTAKMTKKIPSSAELVEYAKNLGIQAIHHKHDEGSELEAFIVVHNINNGPAIGGSRFQHYEHVNLALEDAINLAYRMALKSAAMGLPHGGAKAVIKSPNNSKYDRAKLFETLGSFVEELNGDYITSLDAGTNPEDMDNIIKQTQNVIGATPGHPNTVDPSIYTAYGVFRAMEAAVENQYGHADFTQITVAIQGAGHVAEHLVDFLLERGAKIVITDIRPEALAQLRQHPNLETVGTNEIFDVACDIFSPCALGASLNDETIARLKCSMIVGAANNQLSDESIARKLHEKSILYLPDFIVNAGGVIAASEVYHGANNEDINDSVDRIYHISKQILKAFNDNNQLPHDAAIELAKANLKSDYDKNK